MKECLSCNGTGSVAEKELNIYKPTDEAESNMKCCLLCKSDTGSYSKSNQSLHELFGLHSTNGHTWQPNKGHKDYETHLKMKELSIITKLK